MKKGFTLLELLLGITMTALVFFVATNLVIAFVKVNGKSQTSQSIESAKSDISNELSDMISWGGEVSYDHGVLKVGTTTYSVEEGIFEKNGKAFIGGNVRVDNFDVQKFQAGNQTSFQVTVNLTDVNDTNVHDSVSVYATPHGEINIQNN